MLIIITLAVFGAILLGGLFALRFKDKLHLILGFSAGSVIGVAFFDLLPESLELVGGEPHTATALVALGFVAYLVLDRLVVIHTHTDGEDPHKHVVRGQLGAGSLSIHSLLDGAAVGLAFQVSASLGAIVAVAVIVHGFSDGINTVNLILKNGGTVKMAFRWLLVDAAAPVLGIASTAFFSLSEGTLGIVLSLFTGFFLYLGASDLLPESHHSHPTAWTTFMTVLGVAVLFVVIRVAGL